VLKIIQEYLPNHSMSNLVKKIPDDMAQMNNVETGLRSKAAVFIQKATLTWMNRVIKNNFIKQFQKDQPQIYGRMKKAYSAMMRSF
jgi:hypothetical protein